MKVAALIVAAGRGSRAGFVQGVPKQYALIGGRPVFVHALHAFASIADIEWLQVVVHPDDDGLYRKLVARIGSRKLLSPVAGGQTRQQSGLNGLKALAPHAPDTVLIHDAARPFVSTQTITQIIAALKNHDGAIAAVRLADTLKRAGAGNIVEATIDRANLWRAQTPQGFRFDAILKAHQDAQAHGVTEFTDDAAIAEWAGLPVAIVEDSAANIKLTTAEDVAAADQRLATGTMANMETRTASGFDVHKFTDGDHVWLGGVKIPHTQRLDGHSDADVVLHALTDALLGTIGDGDIGQHFPPSDPQWKGAASHVFLSHAATLVRKKGGRIINVDATVLAEAPKIGPHRQEMQRVIAQSLGITPDRVGIKATTTEGLGFTGRREGIAAMASATVRLPVE